MLKKNLLSLFVLLYLPSIGIAVNTDPFPISSTGYFIGNVDHITDFALARGILNIMKKDGSITLADFGCGHGEYVNFFIENGVSAIGFDGNPFVQETSKGTCFPLDLSVPSDLDKKFDWVISLEVGEHLPPQYEKIFIENLLRHAKDKLILSWSNSPGWCHFNLHDNEYIKNILSDLGWDNDPITEKELRSQVSIFWFEDTLMVFKKRKIN